MNALLLLTIGGLAATALAGHDDCQIRIGKLEDRIAQLERVISRLAPAEPAVPVPVMEAPTPSQARFQPPPELIPEIGKIGAEVGLLVASSGNPFQLNRGSFAGGFIDLPLFDRPEWLHGKISYEISAGISQSRTTFETTSNVAQVANLSVLNALAPNGGLANIAAAAAGTGAAPFPVKSSTQTRLRLLQVTPFAVKYTSTALDRLRLRPYGILGFGIYVTIHNQNPASSGVRPDANIPADVLAVVNGLFGGKAPFGAPLVAGQVAQAAELVQRGLPGGNGNIDIGLHSGAGLAIRINRNLSFGFDARYNRIAGSREGFSTLGSRIGLHF